MSDIFKGYEEEYCALSASIGQKTAKVEGLGEAERRPVMKEVEAELTQASELLEQMALEVRSVPAAESSRLNTTLKGYKADLAASRGALREAEATATRVDLLGGGAGAELPTEERSRLLAVNERLQEGARTLRNAERTVLETEAIGASILGDLRTQRETIEHASGTLRGANDNLARSKRLIQGIARRALANKLLMWLMIVVLGLLDVVAGVGHAAHLVRVPVEVREPVEEPDEPRLRGARRDGDVHDERVVQVHEERRLFRLRQRTQRNRLQSLRRARVLAEVEERAREEEGVRRLASL